MLNWTHKKGPLESKKHRLLKCWDTVVTKKDITFISYLNIYDIDLTSSLPVWPFKHVKSHEVGLDWF